MKKLMLVHRRPPHGTIYAQESLDIALMAAAFDQRVYLAFVDDGVYQLVRGQYPAAVGMKDFAKAFRALADHGVDKLCVELESLQARGLTRDDLLAEVELLDSDALGKLMEAQDIILSA